LEGITAVGLSHQDLVRWEGPFIFSTGVAAAEAFLRMKERPTGIFAACDESAIGFIKTVRAERIRVPQDVSVIGFDGIEFADYTEPTLTTFRQPLHELGRVGADVLMKLIRGEMKAGDWNVRLPLTLLERDTTGPVLHKDYKSLRRSSM
jgi:LacI family repressor for deo operon, udp, cdd, tsx, nupC, and nupG